MAMIGTATDSPLLSFEFQCLWKLYGSSKVKPKFQEKVSKKALEIRSKSLIIAKKSKGAAGVGGSVGQSWHSCLGRFCRGFVAHQK